MFTWVISANESNLAGMYWKPADSTRIFRYEIDCNLHNSIMPGSEFGRSKLLQSTQLRVRSEDHEKIESVRRSRDRVVIESCRAN